jgi:hypothetical protein
MIDSGSLWGAHQLPEFLAVISSYQEPSTAALAAAEWTAEVLDAEDGVAGGETAEEREQDDALHSDPPRTRPAVPGATVGAR